MNDVQQQRVVRFWVDVRDGDPPPVPESWPEDHREPFSYETGSNPDGGWRRAGYPPGNPQ